ncbi:MAG: arginine repressor [Streptococcaceae bacterium]|nr:arginine repressor [Streptococcaceae bacterium]
MKRQERIAFIQQLISEQEITTQDELLSALHDAGENVSQATLSRDLRDYHIAKEKRGDRFVYAAFSGQQNPENPQQTTISGHYITRVAAVEFMLVIHTGLGEADLLANEFDRADRGDVLGTVAGADTLLVICTSARAASELAQELRHD